MNALYRVKSAIKSAMYMDHVVVLALEPMQPQAGGESPSHVYLYFNNDQSIDHYVVGSHHWVDVAVSDHAIKDRPVSAN